MSKFLVEGRPTFTTMIQGKTPNRVIELMKKADDMGADSFGIQIEIFDENYKNIDDYKRIIESAKGKGVYVTHYPHFGSGDVKFKDVYAKNELVKLAKAGASLIDIPGDLYRHEPGELTKSPKAIQKQKDLIDKIHSLGAEVLMSSHVLEFRSGDEVLEIAKEHKARGADISKIVTWANSIEEEIENLKTTVRLKKELGLPFLFLSGGVCHFHRTIGPMMGCDMWLCVAEHDELSTPYQPKLDKMKLIYDNFNCTPTDKAEEVYLPTSLED